MPPLLQIEDLTVSFATDEGRLLAVDHVSFTIDEGEILGLVGESGCGKSVTAMSALRLLPSPPGRIESGRILFRGRDLLSMPMAELRRIRGASISMIFQEPMTALSPLHRVGHQLVEALRLHRDMTKSEAVRCATGWLTKVGIPDAAERMYAYPFQLSGGMRQRVMIAMALMLDPDLVIADEPTTALDVTVQAQIFDLLRAMKQEKTAILLITHDMGVIWEMCSRVIVMYASEIVEVATRDNLFARARHPYAQALLASIPSLDTPRERLRPIAGQVPSALRYPAGCRFMERCVHAVPDCAKAHPPLLPRGDGLARCIFDELPPLPEGPA
jgi:peptide/nickel transport system ATP-binding protein/oligopeptide transport system ATP-binding protein